MRISLNYKRTFYFNKSHGNAFAKVAHTAKWNDLISLFLFLSVWFLQDDNAHDILLSINYILFTLHFIAFASYFYFLELVPFLYIFRSYIYILFLLTFGTKNPLIYLQLLSNLHLWVDVPLQQKQNTIPKKVTRHKQDSKVTKLNFLPDGVK